MFDTGDTWMMASSPVPGPVPGPGPGPGRLQTSPHRHSSVLANHAGMLNLY